MKKILFLLTFFALAAVGAQAQSKAACSKKSKAEAKACTKADKATIEAALKADPSVEARTDKDGSTYYVRKVAGENGEVSYQPVKYCTKSGKFINESPSASASCHGDKAKVKAAADGKKKACCADGAKKGKACCAKKDKKSDDK